MAELPSTTWRMLSYRAGGQELPKGIDAAYDVAAGLAVRLKPRRAIFLKRAGEVLELEPEISSLSDARLGEQARDLRDRFRRSRETPKDVLRAFATVREVAFRQLGEKPYLVQVAGALSLYAGCMTEMATGEGKTLTATLPATVAGWRGRGCHIITVNDYLAQRDAEWMSQIYRFCGLSCRFIIQEMPPPERREAYRSDITYCTNKEVTADFLRDRLSLGRTRSLSGALLTKIAEGHGSGTDRLVQRGLHYAIVDEADSVLIDEAVTPLIISGDAPNPEQVQAFQEAAEVASELALGTDYRVNERYRDIDLTNAGKRRLRELTSGLGGIWAGARRREEMITQALTARQFYTLDKQYVIQEEKVVIVDEFTGRLMPDREWRDGLHQAVAAKEKVPVESPKDTYARVSFQRFFRLYKTLSGMTGTAAEARGEFWQIYHRPVVVIPTNRPCIRQVRPDRVFATEEAKWKAIVEEIRQVHQTGRPLLIGTRSVRNSELLSGMLADEGLDHQVLNAVRHREEAQIVAGAGQPGKITVATNMAGRGTDIKLGTGIAELGGLHVIATERHEAGRIDRQLFGRSARQGDPGSAGAFVCLEDELVARYTPHATAAFRRRFGQTGREISSRLTRRLFDVAQARAQRMALKQRKGVLKTDDWLDEYLGFAGSER
ncbi:MAG TPA: prepilin peptidase [Phycisphaerae bacterium]|nr:prepilin peptidase [Phycisphaerae bacterium]HUU21217.1 prepilin peptidase [Phycisphaerae bacterium]